MREENIDPTAVTAYDDEEALDRPWTMTDEIRAFLAQEAQSPEFLSPDDQIQIKGKVSDLAAFGQRVGG